MSNSGLSKMMGSGVRLRSGCCVINTLSFMYDIGCNRWYQILDGVWIRL